MLVPTTKVCELRSGGLTLPSDCQTLPSVQEPPVIRSLNLVVAALSAIFQSPRLRAVSPLFQVRWP